MVILDELLSQQYEISLNLVLRPFGDFYICICSPILICICTIHAVKIQLRYSVSV